MVTVAGLTGVMIAVVLPTLLIARSGPLTERLAEALTSAASSDFTATGFVAGPEIVAIASMVALNVPPPVQGEPVQPASEIRLLEMLPQTTEPFVPTVGDDCGEFVALTNVNPGGRASVILTNVVVVCELFVTTIEKRTVSPRLTTETGVPGAEARATPLVTVSDAVRTATPVVSVPVSVPTLVISEPVLKNVPPLVPAVVLKTKVLVLFPGMSVLAGIVHVTELVPVTPLGVARVLTYAVAT